MADRTDAILALFGRGTKSEAETISSLEYLRKWAKLEAKQAETRAYGEKWLAEYNASTEALRGLDVEFI